ncbi:sensor histidine kinase [Bradyrhizobium sp. DOA1]|uniref:sensor histidine kinase n=1 Tax=Bradyrhizobium sp. DOA1 TaxID=1126616 RepID=UPI00077C582C|nr:sensor histidine kinase [Bradyrhizobium sp. DOA1]
MVARTAIKSIAALLATFVPIACDAAPSRKIFIVETQSPWLPATRQTIDAFVRKVRQGAPEHVDIFIDYLELSRLPAPEQYDALVRYLTRKYSATPPDVLLTLGRAAVPFLQKNQGVIGSNTPVIVANIPAAVIPDMDQTKPFIYVASRYDFVNTLTLAQQLQPGAKNVLVIGGASDYDRQWLEDARLQLEPSLGGGLTARFVSDISYEGLREAVAKLDRETIVILSIFLTDSSGRSHTTPDVAVELARASGAPVYSPVPGTLGTGIVGGYADDWGAQGEAAADIALQLLAGRDVIEIPRLNSAQHRHRIDARQLKRWALNASALPPNSEVSFRESNFWEKYRWIVLGTLAIILLQTGAITWLIIERRRRVAAECELRQSLLQVIHLNRTAAAGALSTSVAHELNQPLAAIRSYAEAAALHLKVDPPDLQKIKQIVEHIINDDERAADIIRHIRELVKGRSSSEVEEFDLNEAVKNVGEIVRPESTKSGIKLRMVLSISRLPVRADRIQVQQAIINLALNAIDAVRESPVNRKEISISTARSSTADAAELSVVDSGLGIPAEKLSKIFETFYTTKRQGTGLGLTVARTIVESCGGRIWAENHPGGGAEFRFKLPLSEKR